MNAPIFEFESVLGLARFLILTGLEPRAGETVVRSDRDRLKAGAGYRFQSKERKERPREKRESKRERESEQARENGHRTAGGAANGTEECTPRCKAPAR